MFSIEYVEDEEEDGPPASEETALSITQEVEDELSNADGGDSVVTALSTPPPVEDELGTADGGDSAGSQGVVEDEELAPSTRGRRVRGAETLRNTTTS